MDQLPTERARNAPARVRLATVAVSLATAALAFLPPLFAHLYAKGDAYYCGDLGSLGAAISGWFVGLLVLVVTVMAVVLSLRRLRVLLVLPPVAVAHYALGIWDPQWPPTMRLCGETMSVFVPVLLVALAGGLTYALTRGAETEAPPAA